MCSIGSGEGYDSSARYNTAGPASVNGSTNNTHFGPFSSLMPQSHHQNPNFLKPPPSYLHTTPSQPSIHLPHPPPSAYDNESEGGGRHDHGHGAGKAKKRNRAASRRATTTVITTDTSNFRSMVREFTGIPSPPSSLSRRFHPFRPSPRHLHPPYLSSSLNINNNDPTENNNAPTITTSSHQDLGFAFQTPLPAPFIGPKSQPFSGSDEWPVHVPNSWPSPF